MYLPLSFCKTLLILFLFYSCTFVQGQTIQQDLDRLLSSHYPEDGPGATAIVTKGGETIYRNAFGKANLELDVDMRPDHVFEIGSITKQFTAVSILMLVEQGKLSLTDEITKFLPDYPTHGHTITLHHLMNHTSGIKSYTSIPSFMQNARKDMTPKELIDTFKDEPIDFAPGEAYEYNNSAYIILGYIIEDITGSTYEDYVEEKLFKPAGMTNSRYGHKREIIKNRATGYQPADGGFEIAEYLSMTLPYAAGSLMSNVDDLSKWQIAMNKNMFITEASKQLAWDDYTLNDGSNIGYGYGWGPGKINGTKSVEHGGGIFGYETMGIYVPEEDVYVAVLTNSNGSNSTDNAIKVAAISLGKPYPEVSKSVSLSSTQLEKWTGAYEYEDGAIRFITLDGDQLKSQRKGSETFDIYPATPNSFFFEDGMISYDFTEDTQGKYVTMHTRMTTSKGKLTDIDMPEPRKEITLSADKLKEYVGKYELAPGFVIEVTTNDGKIYGQPTGQPKSELFAEAEDKFFLKVVEATTTFSRGEDGAVTSMTLFQNGREMPGKLIDASHGELSDKDSPESRKEITLSADKLKEYVGKYELAPGFIIDITTKGERIYLQATGQGQLEIFAESKDTFFLKAVEAKTVFTRGEDGSVESMTLFQNGREMPGKKIE